MKPNLKNDGSRPNRAFSQLAAEKKKTFIALCLIGVMAFMWVRVLGKKTPQAAEATLTAQEASLEDELNSQLKISFIELPKVAGRNDALTRDFFAAKDWRNFMQEGGNLAGSEEVVRRITEQLKLVTIVLGENPQVFINDRLLEIGDKLLVTDGFNKYECEIIGIEEMEVLVRCGEAEIKLRLATGN